MLPVFNSENMIEEVLEHLISQDIPLVIVDNGSTDNTFQICEKFLDKGVLQLEQFKTTTYPYHTIVRKLYDMAILENPDWVIRSDSDQLMESGMNMTLKDAITQVDAEGYNIIQCDEFNFFMTEKDDASAKSIKEKLLYYSYQHDFLYKAWKFVSGILVTGQGLAGHFPIFPDDHVYKTFNKKFIIRHYQFTSKQQAKDRIQDFLSRNLISFNHRDQIYPIHKIVRSDYSSPVDPQLLTKYNEDGNWNLERKHTPYEFEGFRYLTSKNIFSRSDLFNKLRLEKELNQAKGELSDSESTINNMQNKLSESESTINNMQNKLSESESAMDHMQNELSESTINNVRNDLSESTINNIQKELDTIHQSFSWKTFRKFESIKQKLNPKKS